MATRPRRTPKTEPERWHRGADVPMRVIRRFARQVAERFQPEKIILFGSQAYGTPHEDSDVDILVVIEARNELGMAFKIRWALQPPFSLDLHVYTPKNMKWRLEEGDWFLREVVARGKVLYDKGHARMGAKGRSRPEGGPTRRRRSSL